MPEVHRNFIAGEWVGGASAKANVNPSNVKDVIGDYAQADAAHARSAIAAAKAAAPAWAAGSIQERSILLDRVGTEILARKDELGPFRAWLESTWDGALYRLKLRAELEEARRGPRPRERRRKA